MASDKQQYDDYDQVPESPEASYADESDYASEEDASGGGFFSRVRWGRVALAILFAFLVLAACLFAWNRWYRFDDLADIQGSWRDASTGKMLEINDSYLKIDGDVVYEYTLDTFGKTITYKLNDDQGQSSYRFSENRRLLVLEDGAGTDWGLVLHFRDDPGFADDELPDGMTRLEKTSDSVPTIALPGSSRERTSLVAQSAPAASSSSSSSSSASSSAAGSAATESASGNNTLNGVVIPEEEQAARDAGLLVYNEQGMLGYFNSSGQWVDSIENWMLDTSTTDTGQSTGYYDAAGNWISGTGYYDAAGNWIDTSGIADDQAAGTESLYGDATGTYGTDAYGAYGTYGTDAYGNAYGATGTDGLAYGG